MAPKLLSVGGSHGLIMLTNQITLSDISTSGRWCLKSTGRVDEASDNIIFNPVMLILKALKESAWQKTKLLVWRGVAADMLMHSYLLDIVLSLEK